MFQFYYRMADPGWDWLDPSPIFEKPGSGSDLQEEEEKKGFWPQAEFLIRIRVFSLNPDLELKNRIRNQIFIECDTAYTNISAHF